MGSLYDHVLQAAKRRLQDVVKKDEQNSRCHDHDHSFGPIKQKG